MITFPNAKINLGLLVTEKRPDGYHNLDSCFYPIPWQDVLEITEAETLSFTSTGLPIPGKSDDNLCLKAYHLLKEKYDLPPVAIHLHKAIPMGAGLGGGSADGAFTLTTLNEKFSLGINTDELKVLAAKLGSDCPFFIDNKPAYATETGTTLTAIELSLKNKFIALKHPGIHISTAEAYGGVSPKMAEQTTLEIVQGSITEWKALLKNDFETSVENKYPEIIKIKNEFYEADAIYASMTGSGSCVYGIFNKFPQLILPDVHIFKL